MRDSVSVMLFSTLLVTAASCGTPSPQGAAAQKPQAAVKASDLVQFVKDIHTEKVKRSTGTYDYNCFTDIDLQQFTRDKQAAAIADFAVNKAKFKVIVAKVRELPEDERKRLLENVRNIASPTFAQCGGRPRPDGSCQTDAGQQAERMVSAEIVNRIEALLNK